MNIKNIFMKPCLNKKRPKVDGKCFALIGRVKNNKIQYFDNYKK